MTGEIRHLTIKDGRWLTNKQLQRKGKLIDRILSECWVSTIDNGIYDFNGSPAWEDALIGDRDFALLAIRNESWGSYEFRITCDSCEHRFVWELDLEDMLEQQRRPLTDESKKNFTESNVFTAEVDLDEKRIVKFKLATGKDALRAVNDRRKSKRQTLKNNEGGNLLLDAVKVRLRSVDGIEDEDLNDYLESLPMRCLRTFIETFDSVDCGIDTTVEYECPQCDAQDEIDLPFDQGFFFPRSAR